MSGNHQVKENKNYFIFVETFSLKGNRSVMLGEFRGKNRNKTDNLILFSLAP